MHAYDSGEPPTTALTHGHTNGRAICGDVCGVKPRPPERKTAALPATEVSSVFALSTKLIAWAMNARSCALRAEG